MKHTENYTDGDFEIEDVIANLTFDFGEKLGDLTPKAKKPTAQELDVQMIGAIAKCRSLGMEEEEIVHSIEVNLGCYGYDKTTFPISRWMEE